MKCPERIVTARLLLRKPSFADAEAIFTRYAADPDVARFMSWPRHRTVEDSQAFLEFCEQEWQQWPAGPYLIESEDGGRLLGSTGLAFETPTLAITGYVLARDAWGFGYATEALNAMVDVARAAGVRQLKALCHAGNRASAHVLEKCEFSCVSAFERQAEFPNLGTSEPQPCLCYIRDFE